MFWGNFKGVSRHFPGSVSTLVNPSVFCEFAHKKLHFFCPKFFFATTCEHARKISLFFVSLLATTN